VSAVFFDFFLIGAVGEVDAGSERLHFDSARSGGLLMLLLLLLPLLLLLLLLIMEVEVEGVEVMVVTAVVEVAVVVVGPAAIRAPIGSCGFNNCCILGDFVILFANAAATLTYDWHAIQGRSAIPGARVATVSK
jgi:hypothetical protein